MKILVTGGSGFIGSNFIRHIISKYKNYYIINLDKLTYSGNKDNLRDIENNERYSFIQGDICDEKITEEIIKDIDVIVHFAAESHVTRSESQEGLFEKTNVEGTRNLLEITSKYNKKFIHMSTDEVYGSKKEGLFSEKDKIQGDSQATSPYAKSKARADDLVQSYSNKIETVIIRATNNFGSFQYPEKAMPRWITRLLKGESIPVWGTGENVRDWLYVGDTCKAIDLLLHKGKSGEIYNIAANNNPEIKNIDLANIIVSYLNIDKSKIKLVSDPRPNHDLRYAIDCSKIKSLGWLSNENTIEQIHSTIDWYINNQIWWGKLTKEAESIYNDIK